MISREDLKDYPYFDSIKRILVNRGDEFFVPFCLPSSENLPFIPL